MSNQEKKSIDAGKLASINISPEELGIWREVTNSTDPREKLKELLIGKKLPAGMAEKYKSHIKEIIQLLDNKEFTSKSKIRLLKQLDLPMEIFAVIGKVLAERHFREEGEQLGKNIETLTAKVKELEEQEDNLCLEITKIESVDQEKLALLRQTVDDLMVKKLQFTNTGTLIQDFATGLGLVYESTEPKDKEVARLKRNAESERIEKLTNGQQVESAPFVEETLGLLDKLAEGTFDEMDFQRQLAENSAKEDPPPSHLYVVEQCLNLMEQDMDWREIRTALTSIENAGAELVTNVNLLTSLKKDLELQTALLKNKYPALALQYGLIENEKNKTVEITDEDIDQQEIGSNSLASRMKQKRESRSISGAREYVLRLLNQFSFKELVKIVKRFAAFSKAEGTKYGTETFLTFVERLEADFKEQTEADPNSENMVLSRNFRQELANALKEVVSSLNQEEINQLKMEIRRISQETVRKAGGSKRNKKWNEENTELLLDESDFMERFERAKEYLNDSERATLSPLPQEKKMLALVGLLRKIANNPERKEEFFRLGLTDILQDWWLEKLEAIMKNKIYEKGLRKWQKKIELKAIQEWSQLKEQTLGEEITDAIETRLKAIVKLYQNYQNMPGRIRTAVDELANKFAVAN